MITKWIGALLTLLCLASSGCHFRMVTTESEAQMLAMQAASKGDSALFAKAQSIIHTHCAGCHTQASHAAFATYTVEDWVKDGYVVAGDPTGSVLYQKLRNNGGDMPQDGTLEAADAGAIRDWIAGIKLPPGADAATLRARSAMQVLNSRCVSCHATMQIGSQGPVPAYSGDVNDFLTGKEDTLALNRFFIQQGLVIEGNAQGSLLFRALSNYGDIGTMPSGGAALSPAEIKSLTDWINQIEN